MIYLIIDSVSNLTHDHCQVCLAADGSSRKAVLVAVDIVLSMIIEDIKMLWDILNVFVSKQTYDIT